MRRQSLLINYVERIANLYFEADNKAFASI